MLLYGSLALLLLRISVCDSHPVITCTTTARDARFTSLISFKVTCPSGCVDSSGSLWGSIVYTHDSSICRAAIHDGRLNDSGGEITVYKQPGQSSNTGVERNSVTSSSYGSWGSSFSFRQTIPDRSLTCTTTARDARFTSQNSFEVTCPSGCVESDGNIWGSAVYTHDSSICRAAIHDGRLTDNGGDLTVFRQPGQSSYTGIERNSITSSSYGAWDSSFTFTSEIPNGFSIICTTTARDARFTSETSFKVTCPFDCVDSNGNVWGNVVYTHDSSICRAAIHDGRLNDSGGEITVYKQPGQSSYTGVERNSVTSSSYGSWGSSFSFRQTIPDRSLTCTTTARDARFTSQNSFEVTCPSGCVESNGNIWGSAVYTHDSSICRAAIHDGRLTDNGGDLTVFRQPGQSSYTGIERNSITSSSYGAWDSSFTFTSEIPNGFSIICTTTARDARFTSETSFKVTCPSDCVDSNGNVWGSIVYTHDSSICRAAIHDGRLNDTGGEVTVYKQPGQSSYTGVERNSVTSSSYGSWGSSFSFRQTIPDRSITCTTTARDARFTSQNSFEVTCSSGCVESNGNIWGSAVYTHDSSICRAAIHDGRLTDNGGVLTVFRQSGQSSYTGIERNSITSSSYVAWDSSFTFTSEIPNGFSIICTTTARDARFTSLTSFEVTCPSVCVESSGSLWGNVVYTHDSSICRAAIHDGRLNDSGGEITVYKQPGQSSYTGVERNSVTSSSYGSWGSSFSFRQTIPDRSITCTTTARDARFTSQNSFEVTCPSGCVESNGNIWGSAVYTHDSSICRAAIHDGRLTDNGGDLTVFRQPGQSSYTGIERNSITSSSYGAWDSSFTFTSEIPNGFSIICTTTARDARFTSLTSFEVTCPSVCVESSGSLWGNVVYTHDSSICRAAIHDGRLNDSGGEITVYKQPGQSSYTGVERNSVTSSSYGSWGSSFSFRQTIPDRSITCTTTARDARFTSQNSFEVTCPSGCVESNGNIWGSAVYTHDSSICRAAIHDGRLTGGVGDFNEYLERLIFGKFVTICI
ncbi:uncharacterized protein LOC143451316 isoform X2 [Clavelina lepadiformis]|uniref:uncharacterized protein LOC143451316 isoform X2 n=1 Tax=Clavelina lepadiformis TaxID=159417 RepID=UPI004041F0E5